MKKIIIAMLMLISAMGFAQTKETVIAIHDTTVHNIVHDTIEPVIFTTPYTGSIVHDSTYRKKRWFGLSDLKTWPAPAHDTVYYNIRNGFVTTPTPPHDSTYETRHDSTVYLTPVTLANTAPAAGYFNYGRTSTKNIQQAPDLKGANISTDLKEIWITPDTWNWQPLDDELAACKAAGIGAGIQIFAGPGVPDFFYNAPYNIARVNTKKPTGTNAAFQASIYPDYMNPAYYLLLQQAYTAIKQHVIAAGYGDVVKYWNMTEGSTGDVKAYKADPLDSRYNISDAQWSAFRYRLWAMVKPISPWPMIFNVSNTYSDLDTVMKLYPNDGIKEGNGGHIPINYNGSKVTATIKKPWSRTETDGSMKQRYSSYTEQINAALPISSLALGIDIFCTSVNDVNTTSMKLFNKYITGTGGISYMHDGIDLADTIRFPVNKYGVVVNPATQSNYNAQIKLLPHNANGQFLASQILAKNINPDRQKKIEAFMAPQGALNMPDSINKSDYGVDLLAGPYEKRLHLVNPNDQQSYWRIGVRGDSYGQWGKTFKNAVFTADNPFATITVTYYDETGTITIGNTTITGTGTKKFVIKDIKASGTSFTINSTLKVEILETN